MSRIETYKVKATMIIDVELEVYAQSEDEAISNFIKMNAKDAIDEGDITKVYTENEEATLIYASYKVNVTNIDYDIDEEDEDALKTLPKTFNFVVNCNPNDLNDEINERIEAETGFCIKGCDYTAEKI